MYPASIPLTFLNLISLCTYQYAELGLISIMRFVGIRIILVFRLSFAELKRNEILNLGTGDQYFPSVQSIFYITLVFVLQLFDFIVAIWIESHRDIIIGMLRFVFAFFASSQIDFKISYRNFINI